MNELLDKLIDVNKKQSGLILDHSNFINQLIDRVIELEKKVKRLEEKYYEDK